MTHGLVEHRLLPLSDRVRCALAHRRGTARALSPLLRTDLRIVRKALGGLEDEGLACASRAPTRYDRALAPDTATHWIDRPHCSMRRCRAAT